MRRLGALAALFAGAVVSACAGTPAAAPEELPAVGEWVYVNGDVAKPERVPVLRGHRPFTLTNALAMVELVGEPKLVECARPGVGLLTYDFDAVLECVIDDPALEPGDVVTVTARR